jgi:DNA gyrase inhibitor GyrI
MSGPPSTMDLTTRPTACSVIRNRRYSIRLAVASAAVTGGQYPVFVHAS